MAGGTHVFDMIRKLKQNRNLRQNTGYKNVKEAYRKITSQTHYNFRSATPKQIAQIRKKIIAETWKERMKLIRILILSILISIALILGIIKLAFIIF